MFFWTDLDHLLLFSCVPWRGHVHLSVWSTCMLVSVLHATVFCSVSRYWSGHNVKSDAPASTLACLQASGTVMTISRMKPPLYGIVKSGNMAQC